MPQFKQIEINNTFWASNEGFKGGRDPMGIQNSSIATYGCLLPGLTNLTGHIRYYGLFCWLLSEYDALDKNGEAEIHQYNFIRRAELALAFMMRNEGIGSVVGSLFVQQGKLTCDNDGYYDLAKGADYQNKEKYWTVRSGAFGQYYAGSMIFFGLIKIEQERFYLRDKGKELASAVKNSIDDDVREMFIACILDGTITEAEANELLPLGLHKIAEGSDEWNWLNQLMTKADGENDTFRRDTIYLILKDISNGVAIGNFVEHRFVNRSDSEQIPAAFGWYFYYLCEVLHYCIESVLCLILNNIKAFNDEFKCYPPVGVFLEQMEGDVISYLDDIELYDSVNEWIAKTDGNITEMFAEVKSLTKAKDYAEATAKSFRLMLRLYRELEENREEILEFEAEYDLKRQRGVFYSKGLKYYVEKHLLLSPRKYVSAIIRQVMNEHTMVAISKMGTSNIDLRKFILEDGRIVLVEQRYPNQTSPRVESMHSFLHDLKYIDENENLTDVALKYLEGYGEE